VTIRGQLYRQSRHVTVNALCSGGAGVYVKRGGFPTCAPSGDLGVTQLGLRPEEKRKKLGKV